MHNRLAFVPVIGYIQCMRWRYPTEEKIRRSLVERVDKYVVLTGTHRSSVGKAAVNDPAVVSRIERGRNFTIAVYTRLHEFLDENWPRRARKRRQKARK